MRPLQLSLFCVLAAAWLAVSTGSAYADYISAVEGDSPLAYWRFDDAGSSNGSTAVDKRDNHDGTYQGSTTLTSAGGGAPIGVANNKAADFNGSTSYVDVGTLAAGALAGFGESGDIGVTVEMWVKSSATTEGKVFGLYDSNYKDCFYVSLDRHPDGGTPTDDRIRVFAMADKSSYTIGGPADDTDITDGTWNYLAITFEGDATNELQVYTANAGDTETTAWSMTYNHNDYDTGTSDDFLISAFIGGANNGGALSVPYTGLIDEVAVYTTALSKSQLDAHLAAIPEPSTLVLLAVGALGLLVVAWRRRRR